MDVTVNYTKNFSYDPHVFLVLDDNILEIKNFTETFSVDKVSAIFQVKVIILCENFVCKYEFYKIPRTAFIDLKVWGHFDFPNVSINDKQSFTSKSTPRNCWCILL